MVKRSNGDGSITKQKRKNGYYYLGTITVGYDDEGTQIRRTFGSYRRAEVVEKMNEAKYEINKGLYLDPDEVSFEEFYYQWIFNYKKHEVSPHTFDKYLTNYNLRIKNSSIGRMKIQDIRSNHLQKFFIGRLETGDSISVLKRLLIHIKSCFNYAIEENIIIRDPTISVRLPVTVDTKENKIKVFSAIEQEKIISSLTNTVVDRMILFSFGTGLRLSEALGLKWSDIEGSNLYVTRQYKYEPIIDSDGNRTWTHNYKPLKTKSSIRTIPLPVNIQNMLKQHYKDQLLEKMYMGTKYNENEVIFADEYGNPIEQKRPTRRLNKLCKDLDIPKRGYHALRHSYATRLFELGVDVKTVQSLLGHSDLSTTNNIYVHVMDEVKLKAVEKLNNII